MAKPILSTPVMKLDGQGDYYHRKAGTICPEELMRLFGRPWHGCPKAIRLRAYARPAKGRRLVVLREPSLGRSGNVRGYARWASIRTRQPSGFFCHNFLWWLRRAPFAARLSAGETIVLYVALEIVKEAE